MQAAIALDKCITCMTSMVQLSEFPLFKIQVTIDHLRKRFQTEIGAHSDTAGK